MNLPNKITLSRIAATPLLVLLMYLTTPWARWCALALFIVASASDLLDGHIARTRNLITDFGKFVDPIADKVLITAAMVMLMHVGHFPAWALILFLTREFVIAAFRLVAADKGTVIAASKWGKYKTLFQTLAVVFLMAFKPVNGAALISFSAGALIADLLLWTALALAIWSCIDYMAKNWKVLQEEK